MKASEYMAWLEAHPPQHVTGKQYCLNLFTLAESVKATRILEFGTGWGWSTTAFLASVSERDGELWTVDDVVRVDPETDKFIMDNGGCNAVGCKTQEFIPKGNYDLVYLDANPSIESIMEDFERVWPHLRPGGLLVVDGMFGQHGPSVFWRKVGLSCTPLQYCDGYAHGVHRKKPWPKHKSVTSVFCTHCRWESKDRSEAAVLTEVNHHVVTTGHIVKSSAITGGGYAGEGTRMTWGAR